MKRASGGTARSIVQPGICDSGSPPSRSSHCRAQNVCLFGVWVSTVYRCAESRLTQPIRRRPTFNSSQWLYTVERSVPCAHSQQRQMNEKRGRKPSIQYGEVVRLFKLLD